MRIVTVVGTRPEAIKLCPLIKELKKDPFFQVTVVLTGQHREMLTSVIEDFGLRAQYNLAVMRKGQSVSEVVSAVMEGLTPILVKSTPHRVLVQGDTATAFAAALAAFYLGIPVGHVEAGLRTYDMFSPFPEEFHRSAIRLAASLHFAPTEGAKANLLREGVEENRIFVTGNTGIDALKTTVKADYAHPLMARLRGKRLILLTAHRRENWGEALESAFWGIRRAVEGRNDVAVVFPMHKNLTLRDTAKAVLGSLPNLHLIEPLSHGDFHNFLARCYCVITDSGGVQEEAPYFGKPVLVLRDATERPEGVAAGVLCTVGCDKERVEKALRSLLDDPAVYSRMAHAESPFGDGNACARIVKVLKETGDFFEKNFRYI